MSTYGCEITNASGDEIIGDSTRTQQLVKSGVTGSLNNGASVTVNCGVNISNSSEFGVFTKSANASANSTSALGYLHQSSISGSNLTLTANLNVGARIIYYFVFRF